MQALAAGESLLARDPDAGIAALEDYRHDLATSRRLRFNAVEVELRRETGG